jgi:hypothetical protein
VDDTEATEKSPYHRFQQVFLELRVRDVEYQAFPASPPRQQKQNGPCLDAVEDEQDSS